jgi:HAD superfamily hydrolase (TIGR01549 family)
VSKLTFKAIVLDLFDTLVKWEPERLPLMELQGRQVRTTMPWVFPKMEELFGADFDQERFIQAYSAVVEEIIGERERKGIEITCHERFARTLAGLRLGSAEKRSELAEILTRTHMMAVRAATWAPQSRVDAAQQLARQYRLGLLSNFDDTQCGYDVLSDTGIAKLFEAVVISAEVLLRKPDRRIFDHICGLLRLDPNEILFVGDTPRDDILGATQAGMRTAWISKGLSTIPEDIPQPDLIVKDLAELPRALGI